MIPTVSFVGKEENYSLRNVLETGGMCISIISDWFFEAANFTSVNTVRGFRSGRLLGYILLRVKR